MIKIILTLIATFNMNTLDTHSLSYDPVSFEYGGYVYQIEEDYSVSMIETYKEGMK